MAELPLLKTAFTNTPQPGKEHQVASQGGAAQARDIMKKELDAGLDSSIVPYVLDICDPEGRSTILNRKEDVCPVPGRPGFDFRRAVSSCARDLPGLTEGVKVNTV